MKPHFDVAKFGVRYTMHRQALYLCEVTRTIETAFQRMQHHPHPSSRTPCCHGCVHLYNCAQQFSSEYFSCVIKAIRVVVFIASLQLFLNFITWKVQQVLKTNCIGRRECMNLNDCLDGIGNENRDWCREC